MNAANSPSLERHPLTAGFGQDVFPRDPRTTPNLARILFFQETPNGKSATPPIPSLIRAHSILQTPAIGLQPP